MYKIPEIKVSYSSEIDYEIAPKISRSEDAVEAFMNHWNTSELEVRERFVIALLSPANQVKGIFEVSVGGCQSACVDAKLVFSVALKTMSTAIILCHNHPSGNTKPSKSDISLTRKLVAASNLLDITVLDHIIITPQGDHYSFADNNML